MPITRRSGQTASNPLKQSFVERIRTGNVVPVLSHAVQADIVFGGEQQLIANYAKHIAYPLEDTDNMLKMVKFRSIQDDMDSWALKSDYLNFLKEYLYGMGQANSVDPGLLEETADEADNLTVSQFANRLGYPQFNRGEDDPLLILASLPLPIYLTTGYHDFLEQALCKAGKKPQSDICRWNPSLDSIPSVFADEYRPSKDAPLVYHLHGIDTYPNSLVLTEDDYLAFLVAVSQGQGKIVDPIPARIRQAVSDSALVLLGYGLSSWAFRVFFWGLIKPATMTHRGVCCLQVVPHEVERKYLQAYLRYEANFEVFWGDIYQYTQELRHLWRP